MLRPTFVLAVLALAGCSDGTGVDPGDPDGDAAGAVEDDFANPPTVEDGGDPYIETTCDVATFTLSVGMQGGATGETKDPQLGDRASNVTQAVLELMVRSDSPLEQALHADVHDADGTLTETDEADGLGVYRLDIPVEGWSTGLRVLLHAADGGVLHDAEVGFCLTTATHGTLEEFSAF